MLKKVAPGYPNKRSLGCRHQTRNLEISAKSILAHLPSRRIAQKLVSTAALSGMVPRPLLLNRHRGGESILTSGEGYYGTIS